jgi:hypothetical protein
MGEETLFDETEVQAPNVYTTGNAKEFAQRQIMGEAPEEIIQSFRERKESTLEQVHEAAEIAWIKSVGECEAFIMASMFQQHVNLTRTQSILLGHLNDSVIGNMNSQLLAEIRTNYDYVSALVDAHERKMDAFKDACACRTHA